MMTIHRIADTGPGASGSGGTTSGGSGSTGVGAQSSGPALSAASSAAALIAAAAASSMNGATPSEISGASCILEELVRMGRRTDSGESSVRHQKRRRGQTTIIQTGRTSRKYGAYHLFF
ncbi:unnamed protein product [Protopolystoma xenopodis]|uniref:Uncharacterized protein n=1 Tax=Protopolystoma xenopodis TaxID=117903 RepID=A0A448XK78_9PLAT|nr:unnamed protein product [Protopolystoma xenopodis]